MRDIDADIAVLAARLRLRHGLRLPDAIQLAVALEEGCYAVVTRDRDFSAVKDVLILGASVSRSLTTSRAGAHRDPRKIGPTQQKAQPAEWRDGTELAYAGKSKCIEAAAENTMPARKSAPAVSAVSLRVVASQDTAMSASA